MESKETMTSQLLLFGLLTVAIGQVLAHEKLIFCYYSDRSRIIPEDINTNYCTHLLFAFANVSGNSLAPYEVNDTVTGGMYYRFNNLKTQKPTLKTLLSVGGWTHGSESFSAMAFNRTNRQEFVQNAVEYLRRYEFDGLDIDWEYPAYSDTGGRDEDKANFAALVKELKKAFVDDARETRKSRLLLTAAVAAGFDTVNRGYNIRSLNRNLDYIGVMAYDLHGSWDQRAAHHAGLFTSHTDPDNLSVSSVVNNWAHGVSNNKLLVGLPLYGRTWTLADPNNHTVGASTIDRGLAGPLSGAPGVLNYREICDALRNENYTREFDNESKAPYAYRGDQWITYDDPVSLRHKMTWIYDNGFAGTIVWAIGLDDFSGTHCGDGEYPLLRRIHQCLVEEYNCSPEDAGSVTSTTARTTNTITTTASIPTTTTTPATTTTSPTTTTTISTTTTTTTTAPTSTTTTTTPTSTTTTPTSTTSTPTPTTTTPTPTTTTPTPTTTTPAPTTTTTTSTTPTSTSTTTPIPTTTTPTPTTTSTTTTPTSTTTTPSTTTTTPTSTTTTTQVSTTTAIPASTVNLYGSVSLDPDCPEYGAHKWYPFRNVCDRYWECVSPNEKYARACPQGTAFDSSTSQCHFAASVECGDRKNRFWNPTQ